MAPNFVKSLYFLGLFEPQNVPILALGFNKNCPKMYPKSKTILHKMYLKSLKFCLNPLPKIA